MKSLILHVEKSSNAVISIISEATLVLLTLNVDEV